MKNKWFANGKLLITGEYLVMEGAKALAVPLKYGQSLEIRQTETGLMEWRANTPDGLWFETAFKLPTLEIVKTTDHEMSEQLRLLLQNAAGLSDDFLEKEKGVSVITSLDFDPQYGFGSSSTLVSCVARWADIDPLRLQWDTFGGSGYDVACAEARSPIIYRKSDEKTEIRNVHFLPPFKDNLFFVYLGKKQQTAGSIRDFRKKAVYSIQDIEKISAITEQIVTTKEQEEFESLLNRHEQIMSGILGMPTIKSLYFREYEGAVKSLGAWGGDFVLVTAGQSPKDFRQQMKDLGFDIIYAFSDLVFAPE